MIFLFTAFFILPYLISVIGAYTWIRKQYNTQWRLISPSLTSVMLTISPGVNTVASVIYLIEIIINGKKFEKTTPKRKKGDYDDFFGIKVDET